MIDEENIPNVIANHAGSITILQTATVIKLSRIQSRASCCTLSTAIVASDNISLLELRNLFSRAQTLRQYQDREDRGGGERIGYYSMRIPRVVYLERAKTERAKLLANSG